MGALAAPPAAYDDRRWSVVLASMSTRDAAVSEVARLRSLGLLVSLRPYRVGDRSGYRIGLGRYPTREQADDAMLELQRVRPGIPAWVARY